MSNDIKVTKAGPSFLGKYWFFLVVIGGAFLFAIEANYIPIAMIIFILLLIGLLLAIGKVWPWSRKWIVFFIVYLLLGSGWVDLQKRWELFKPIVIQRNITEYQNMPNDPVQFITSNEDLIVANGYIAFMVVLALFISIKGWIKIEVQVIIAIIATAMAFWGTYIPNMDLVVQNIPSDIRQQLFNLGWEWEFSWSLAIFAWGLISSAIGEHLRHLQATAKRGSEKSMKELVAIYKIFAPLSLVIGTVFGLQAVFAMTWLSPTIANIVTKNPHVMFIGATTAVGEGQIVGMATITAISTFIGVVTAWIVKITNGRDD